MEELVSKSKIQEYAIKNTSPRMPIEKLYLQAFVDSILNSSTISESYKTLMEYVFNEQTFFIYNSYDPTARIVNTEPYRSIVAYAMMKKDLRLFEMISAELFTGTIAEYHGDELFVDATKTTDEAPVKYTDSGLFTDMNEGRIFIGFKNIYTTKILEDGTGGEYQTLDELNASLEVFDYMITLTKPARVEVLLFYVPFCFITGNDSSRELINIKDEEQDPYFSSPFGNPDAFAVLDAMSDSELITQFKEVSYKDMEQGLELDCDVERTVQRTMNAMIFTYDIRIKSSLVEGQTITDDIPVWNHVILKADKGDVSFRVITKYSKSVENYYERYMPISLSITDSPDGPMLPFRIVNDVPDVAAMFYIREGKD